MSEAHYQKLDDKDHRYSQTDDSTERIVTYLKTKYGVPINILFFKVYSFEGKRFISRAWYLERIAAPASSSDSPSGDWNGEYYVSFGTSSDGRSWEDAQNFGFISAGGGEWYSQTLSMLSIGGYGSTYPTPAMSGWVR